MNYYRTNAVYETLMQTREHSFVWVSGNAWILVYADAAGVPRLLVMAYGASWSRQERVITAFGTLAEAARLPHVLVGFDDRVPVIDSVSISTMNVPPVTIGLDRLKAIYQRFGLPVTAGACGKSVNDATSSAYHKWQRENLGAIKVSDIDLLRLGEDGTPTEIIELKRSYIPLEKWAPYRADYANFNLLCAVSHTTGWHFTIAYNLRQTRPRFHDDASRLSLFRYWNHDTPQRLGIVDFQAFVNGHYTVLQT
ncbi:hypothetical protein GCM10027040_05370 [Halomonas shantousis]